MSYLDEIRNTLTIGNLVATGLISIVLWLRKPGEEAGRAVNNLRDELVPQLVEVQKDLATLQERVNHMPDSEELAELKGTVKTIEAQTVAQSERMQVMTAQLTRIENYLLHSKP